MPHIGQGKALTSINGWRWRWRDESHHSDSWWAITTAMHSSALNGLDYSLLLIIAGGCLGNLLPTVADSRTTALYLHLISLHLRVRVFHSVICSFSNFQVFIILAVERFESICLLHSQSCVQVWFHDTKLVLIRCLMWFYFSKQSWKVSACLNFNNC